MGLVLNIKSFDNTIAEQLDMYEGDSLELIYSINDIRDISVTTGNYSKSFTIPGTKKNNKVFGHIYELGNVNISTFHVNKKLICEIINNGINVFSGYLQLMSITRTSSGEIIDYEVSVFGEITNIFVDMGEDTLDTLDFTKYDHLLNKTNVENSWDTSIKLNGEDIPFLLGRGYVYPLEDRGFRSDNIWKVENFRPAIFAKEYINTIMTQYGYTYESNFFESEYFKKIIITAGGLGILSDDLLYNKTFRATRESEIAIGPLTTGISPYAISTSQDSTGFVSLNSTYLLFDNDSTLGSFDPTNQYNPATGGFNPNFNGYHNLTTKVNFKIKVVESFLATGTYTFNGNFLVKVFIFNVNTQQIVASNAVNIPVNSTFSDELFITESALATIPIDISENDEYIVYANIKVWSSALSNNLGQEVPGFINLYLEPDSSFYNGVIDNTVQDGDMVSLNTFIPTDIKIADFFKSIISSFNLNILQTGIKHLKIEPYDDIYSSGQVVNWTKKVDRSQSMVIKPMSELDFNRYIFSYSEDSDYYNVKYTKDNSNKVFGQRIINVDNDFIISDKVISTIFTPTISTAHLDSARIIPSLKKDKANGSSFEPMDIKPRILFYNLIDLGDVVGIIDDWYMASNVDGNTLYAVLPYAGMLDNPYIPTESLEFGVSDTYYFPREFTTNSNLYNKFWGNLIEDITNENSRLVTCKLFLNAADINNLSLNDIIQLDDVFFRINTVTYNTGDDSATAELFRIDNYTAVPKFKSSSFLYRKGNITSGGTRNIKGGEQSPNGTTGTEQVLINGNTGINNETNSIQGVDNTINNQVSNFTVLGDNNFLTGNAYNGMIIGTGNTLYDGVNNVFVVGDNQTVTESNTAYINGVTIQNGTIVTTGTGTTVFNTMSADTITANSFYGGTFYGDGSGLTGFSFTANNGLTKTGDTIQLGGNLIKNTDISGGYNFTLGNVLTPLNRIYLNSGDSGSTTVSRLDLVRTSFNMYTADLNGQINRIYGLINTGVEILSSDLYFNTNVKLNLYNSGVTVTNNGSNNGMVITDTTNNKGVVYAADYKANFTDESLVSKRYVDSKTDIRVTGGTYSNGTITFRTNSGSTFNVTGLYTGYTAPTDIRVTGGTYSNGTITFRSNSGSTFNVTGLYTGQTSYNNLTVTALTSNSIVTNTISATTYYGLPTDIRVTGGTYSSGTATFTNNVGGSFNVTGFYTPITTYFTSGSTGAYSIKAINATGVDATGVGSFALGSNTLASGNYSFVQGFNSIASGTRAVALNNQTTASGLYSFAGGSFSIASNTNSFSFGDTNTVSGTNSAILGGSNNVLNVARSVILGGSGITGGTADTVFVPSLNIGTIASGTTTNVLVKETNGTVSYRAISNIINAAGVTKEIYISPTMAPAYFNQLQGYYIGFQSNGGTDNGYWTGHIPNDFNSFISVKAIGIPDITSTYTVNIQLQYAGSGQTYSSNTITTTMNVPLVTDLISEIDVTSYFSGLTAGKYFGFACGNSSGSSIHMLGLKILYT